MEQHSRGNSKPHYSFLSPGELISKRKNDAHQTSSHPSKGHSEPHMQNEQDQSEKYSLSGPSAYHYNVYYVLFSRWSVTRKSCSLLSIIDSINRSPTSSLHIGTTGTMLFQQTSYCLSEGQNTTVNSATHLCIQESGIYLVFKRKIGGINLDCRVCQRYI